MDLAQITIALLGLSILTTFIAILNNNEKYKWARNPWCITVLIAVLVGIAQERYQM